MEDLGVRLGSTGFIQQRELLIIKQTALAVDKASNLVAEYSSSVFSLLLACNWVLFLAGDNNTDEVSETLEGSLGLPWASRSEMEPRFLIRH